MTNCIFCKIVNGEIPSEKIYENKDVLAFLDANPVTKGHLLIIPKKHYENIFDIPKDILKENMEVAQRMSFLLKEKLGAEGINLFNNNNKIARQEVPHYHIHLVPRYKDDGLDFQFKSDYKELNLDEIKNKIAKEILK